MLAAVEERPKVWPWWRPAAVLAIASLATVALLVMRPKPEQKALIVAEVKEIPPAPVPSVPLAPPAAAASIPAPQVVPQVPPQKARKTFQPPAAEKTAPAADTMLAEAPKMEAAAAPPPPLPSSIAGALPARPGMIGGVVGGVIGGTIVPPRNSFTTAETVQVTADGAFIQAQPSASSLFYGNRAPAPRVQSSAVFRAAAAPQAMGLRYSILRKQGDDFVEADPESLTKADILALRFTANINGFLSISGAPPVALTAMQPYTTPALSNGATDIRVVFSRTAQTAVVTPVALTTETRGRELFVVNTAGPGPLGFTIALKRK
jgi:hypothetical protein